MVICLLASAFMLQISSLFLVSLVLHFSHFCAFCWRLLLFKMSPKCSEVVPSIPKWKKAVMCFMEKIAGLDKLCSGVNYSAVGKSNANEPTLH